MEARAPSPPAAAPPVPPRRIVSLVPSQTELLADLGLDAHVVGVTRFCVHPAGWKARKTIVGGTKNVNVERVRALAPDLVLANQEENTRADVEALCAFTAVHVTDVRDVAGALDMIRTVGRLTGREPEADALAQTAAAGFAALAQAPPLDAAYLIWRAPYMTVGGDTFIHDVMTHGGLRNVFGGRRRYPAVTLDEIAAARPAVVLLSSEPYPFGDAHRVEVEGALGNVPVHLVDGELFSWYGSRLLQTPAYLTSLYRRLRTPDPS